MSNHEDDSDTVTRGMNIGPSMEEMFGADKWSMYVIPLIAAKNHFVLYKQPVDMINIPEPFPVKLDDKVPVAETPLKQHHRSKKYRVQAEEKWHKVLTNFSKPVKCENELRNMIASYNDASTSQYLGMKCYFRRLNISHSAFTSEEVNNMFQDLIPKIIKLAVSFPEQFPSAIPCLTRGRPGSVSMSQKQVAVLLANAFLCTFPCMYEGLSYPGINFNGLWHLTYSHVMQKIECILHYFKRIFTKMPVGVITFQRKVIPYDKLPKWSYSDVKISSIKLHVDRNGTIENEGEGCLQVDFANKYIGGGVLNSGCVQEEIRFSICPELIASRLFIQSLEFNEAILITGCERFSNYKGYGRTFQFESDHQDTTPYDPYGRRRTNVIAIDAQDFCDTSKQYELRFIKRELNKAYVGFYDEAPETATISPIATGNWGCGAFSGNPQLKALLQIMACAVAKRDIIYYTFGNATFQTSLYEIFLLLKDKDVTVGQLYNILLFYNNSSHYKSGQTVFDYVKDKLTDGCNLSTQPQKSSASTTHSAIKRPLEENSEEFSSTVAPAKPSTILQWLRLSKKREEERKKMRMALEDTDN